MAITWSWLGFETSWGCAAAVPAPRSANIDVMSSATVANKMMRLIVSHLLSHNALGFHLAFIRQNTYTSSLLSAKNSVREVVDSMCLTTFQ